MQQKTNVKVGITALLSPSYLKTFVSAGGAVKDLQRKTQDLNRQASNVSGFRAQQNAVKAAGSEWKAARQKAADLRAEIAATGTATRAQTAALNRAEAQTRRTSQAYQEARGRLNEMNQVLQQQGTNVNRLSSEYRRLQSNIRDTAQAQGTMEQRLRTQQQLTNGLATTWSGIHRSVVGIAGAVGGASMALSATGKPAVVMNREARSYETESARVKALGMSDHDTKEAIAFSRSLKTFGTSQAENLMLMRDGITAFADVHHAEMAVPTLAQMKFANHTFYGEAQGANNERMFIDMLKVIELRGGTNNREMFEKQANMVQQVITATGGRVGPEDWRKFIRTGGVATKQMRDDVFYYQMEPLVQEMGGDVAGTGLMSAYSNIYQGKTTKRAALNLEKFGLIGDMSKVTEDKVGQLKYLNPGALKGYELYRESPFEWMQQVMLPEMAKRGITERGEVLDAIASVFSNRTASNLFSTMYLQQPMIEKSYKMNSKAYTIPQMAALGETLTAGKELEAKARIADAELRLGQEILPTYTTAVEMATQALHNFNAWLGVDPKNAPMAAGAVVGVAGVATAAGAVAGYKGATGVYQKLTGTTPVEPAGPPVPKEILRAQRVGRLLKYGKVLGPAAAVGVGGVDAYSAYADPTLSDNKKKARYLGAGLGTAGAIGGGYGGASAGAAAGAAIGVWFGGVGAVPGAIIGGLIGGGVGGYGGGKLGSMAGNAAGEKIWSDDSKATATAAQEAAKAAQEAAKAATIKPNVNQTFNSHMNVTVNEAVDGKMLVPELQQAKDRMDRQQAATMRSEFVAKPQF